MTGHIISAECDCGYKTTLMPGSAGGMAYTEAEDDLCIRNEKHREIPDPFLYVPDQAHDWNEWESVQARRDKPYGPYPCPKCKRATLMLQFSGNWDGVAEPSEEPAIPPTHTTIRKRFMDGRIATTVLLGLSALIAAFLIGGRYQAVSAGRGDATPIVYIVDRFTGNVWFCGGTVCRQSGPMSN